MTNDGKVHDMSLQSRVDKPSWMRDDIVTDGSIFFLQIADFAEDLPRWTYWPARRDKYLRQFFKTEPIFAGTVYSMTSRMKALPLQISGPYADRAKEVLRLSDFHAGFPELLSKTIQDLATQDNGAFWELIGPGRANAQMVGPPQAIEYLDPAQCIRTFDPEFPVLYVNPITHDTHKLHRSRVVSFSNLPQPDELARGVGYSVLSRAFTNVQTIRAMHRFRYEKVTGRFERGIIHGRGTTAKQLDAAFNVKQAENEAVGLTYYGKIPVLISVDGVELDLLDLASLPDGFDLVEEITMYVYAIALAWGVDAREFWPATASGATKADATIQHLKAQGKGIADLIHIIESALNERILPEGTEAKFDFVDDEHDRAVIEAQDIRVRTLSKLKQDGILNEKHYLATLIEERILNPNTIGSADQIIQEASSELLTEINRRDEEAREMREIGIEERRNSLTENEDGDENAPEVRTRNNNQDGVLATRQRPFRR